MTLDDQEWIVGHVRTIISALGHQLEEEIASKELWQEHWYKLQKSKKLYNNTDRRKLSETQVLGRAELIHL